MISYRQSQNILKRSKINIGEETIKTQDCLNRVSATNIFCKENNPLDNNRIWWLCDKFKRYW